MLTNSRLFPGSNIFSTAPFSSIKACLNFQTAYRSQPATKSPKNPSKMKAVVVALFALVAISSAQLIPSWGLGSPLIAPLAHTYAAAPIIAAPVAVAPAIQTGYVAANRGAVHTAPLPEGPLAFSHHINTAPAPGTL